MAKPIFLIQWPVDMPPEKVISFTGNIADKLTDWHVMSVTCLSSGNEPIFTAFSEQTATDIELEELKQILLNQLK